MKDCVVNGIYFQKFFGLEFLNEILCVDSKNVIRISPLLFLYSSDNAETDDGGVDEMKEIEAATEKPLVTTIEQLRKIQLGYSTIMNDQGHVIFLSMQKMPDHFVYSLHRILSYFLGVVFGNLIIPTVEDSNIYKKNVTVEEGYGVIFQSADAQDVQNFGKCFDLYNIYVSTYARTHTSITNES